MEQQQKHPRKSDVQTMPTWQNLTVNRTIGNLSQPQTQTTSKGKTTILQRPKSSTILHWKRLAITLCLTTILLSGCAEPEMEDLKQFVAATKAASPGKKLEPLPTIEPYSPFTYTSQGLKDPFAYADFMKKPERPPPGFLQPIPGTIHPDPNRPREELEKFTLGSLQMVGTFVSTPNDDLWALIKAPDGIVHRVRQGNHIGADHGQILSITDQRIDLLEIISDGDSGWKERDAFLSLAE